VELKAGEGDDVVFGDLSVFIIFTSYAATMAWSGYHSLGYLRYSGRLSQLFFFSEFTVLILWDTFSAITDRGGFT